MRGRDQLFRTRDAFGFAGAACPAHILRAEGTGTNIEAAGAFEECARPVAVEVRSVMMSAIGRDSFR